MRDSRISVSVPVRLFVTHILHSYYDWNALVRSGADNLIPVELALKIASKIKANEQFAVYIVLPMWPEGIPTAAPMQQILFWQVCRHLFMQITTNQDADVLICYPFEGPNHVYDVQDHSGRSADAGTGRSSPSRLSEFLLPREARGRRR
jgi:hypothetical protein